jgi:hypothetical protein
MRKKTQNSREQRHPEIKWLEQPSIRSSETPTKIIFMGHHTGLVFLWIPLIEYFYCCFYIRKKRRHSMR